MLDKFMTHLLLLEACNWLLLPIDCVLVPLPILLLLANLLNLFTRLSLINLDSLTLFMNSVHLFIAVVVTIDNSLDLHLSNLTPASHRMPLMHLILS